MKKWINSLSNPEEKLASIVKNIPLENRMTTAEEIANAVAFLLSGKSSHTTGQLIHVDGGYVHLGPRACQCMSNNKYLCAAQCSAYAQECDARDDATSTEAGNKNILKMRTLVLTEPGKLEYKDVESPAMQKGHALLRIKRVGICGTDLHAYEGTQPYFNYPRILGHELAAEIVDTDAAGFSNGELVTIIPYFNCGNCIACRNGNPIVAAV